MAATCDLLVDRGVAGTGFADVAAAANVSTSSLHHRFRVKKKMLDYCHAVFCQASQNEIDAFAKDLLKRGPAPTTRWEEIFGFAEAHAQRTGAVARAFRRAGTKVPSILQRDSQLRRHARARVEDTVLRLLGGDLYDTARAKVGSTVAALLSVRGGDDVWDPTLPGLETGARASSRTLPTLD